MDFSVYLGLVFTYFQYRVHRTDIGYSLNVRGEKEIISTFFIVIFLEGLSLPSSR